MVPVCRHARKEGLIELARSSKTGDGMQKVILISSGMRNTISNAIIQQINVMQQVSLQRRRKEPSLQ